jgi:predicted metal-dependent hydrolase
MFGRYLKIIKKKRVSADAKHYQLHKEAARKIIFERLRWYAPLCGVEYKRVAIRNQRRRWGSCSSLRNLNFNYRLAFLPEPLCDYVIVHELCHLKELNHGPKFWSAVEAVLPNYQELIGELRIVEKRLQMEGLGILDDLIS